MPVKNTGCVVKIMVTNHDLLSKEKNESIPF